MKRIAIAAAAALVMPVAGAQVDFSEVEIQTAEFASGIFMPVAEYDDSHGGGFMNPETYTRLVYTSLTRWRPGRISPRTRAVLSRRAGLCRGS